MPEASLSKRVQEMGERISGTEDKKEVNTVVTEMANVK